MLYGGRDAAIVSGLADLIGALAFPIAPFFPGFTLSAILAGYIRGTGFHGSELTLKKISLVVVINQLVTSLLLNTLWIFLINDSKNFLPILTSRLFGVFLNTIFQIFLTYYFSKSFYKSIKKSLG